MNNINCNLRFPRKTPAVSALGPLSLKLSTSSLISFPGTILLPPWWHIFRCFFKLILSFAPCFNVCHFSSHFWFSSFVQGENFAQLFNISLIIMFILNTIKLPFHFLARDIKILQSSYSPIFPHICFWWKSCCHAHLWRVFHDSKFT